MERIPLGNEYRSRTAREHALSSDNARGLKRAQGIDNREEPDTMEEEEDGFRDQTE
jgi:hypothetical protein